MKLPSFRTLQWIFPIAVALHNSEEALSMPKWLSAHAGRLPFYPQPRVIWSGLLLLTLAAFAFTSLSARKGAQSIWAYLLFGGASTMLLNVFVPHLPATLILRAYTPGVVTALLINLPVMSLLLYKALHDHWVSGAKAVAYALLVPVGVAACILSLFMLS